MNEIDGRDFVHLHVHTEYSLLDGSGKIPELIDRACELGMKSLAITDHGAMYGCVEFYKNAKEKGIKPIIGCEIYVAQKSLYIKHPDRENETHHLVLLVKNDIGYKNLMKIVSKGSIDGFYYKPRVDHEYLKEHSEGLIALSACLAGEIPSNLMKNNIDDAYKTALLYKEIFKDGFYLELQNHGIREQLIVNEKIVEMSKKLNIPLVATNDVHYITQDDFNAHDILLCIQTGKTVDDEKRMRYPSDQFYLKSGEEMYEQFSYVPEAIENTKKIADMCNFDYEFHKSKLPNFPLAGGIDHFGYLKDLCYKGLHERYDPVSPELKDRLEYELKIINQMGYVDYFLIVWDFIRFAREKGIMTGPGRGSAAGSIVAYTLKITKIDPIKYNLIFERFLNPDRVSMPDIDSDFCYERRQEVIDYVVEKYGKDCVAQIVTFGTMAARACIRDVGRAMNYSYSEVDRVAKMIPSVLNITIDKALELNPDFKSLYDEDERVKKLIDISRSLEGLPRHTSTHAAGVVIASKPLVDFVPLLQNDGAIVTQFTMNTLEELGLLKMDFLGLRTLTVMRDTVAFVKQNREIQIELDNINFEDEEVYKMIGDGKTVGVFQLESSGMTSFMKELKPDSLEDIIAGISLYRPGPMNEIPTYIKNKNNPSLIEYETPELEHILNVTYGCMVYQEQVMQIVRDLAGYSMGRSDLVRRAMAKKKHKVMEEERHNFIYGIVDENGKVEIPGCVRNGIDEGAANRIFDSMIDFASYAFNKSHAAAYAVIAYQTAYLMRYFPAEFIAAMLNSVMGDNDKVSFYIRYAEDEGIEVLPPDINESMAKFTVKGNTIRFGLAEIKNVGTNAIVSITDIRKKSGKFTNFMDFCSKIDQSVTNKRTVESLIKAGAFDEMGVFRSKLLAVFEKVMDGVGNQKKRNLKGQMSFFSDYGKGEFKNSDIKYPDIKEFDKRSLLSMEKEMTGLYLSGNPLSEYEKSLKILTSIKISDIIHKNPSKIKDGDKVIIGGIISGVNRKITKNNNRMAFITLEDLYGSIEVIVFPTVFEKYSKLINQDGLVIIKGYINFKEDEAPKVICDSLSALNKINKNNGIDKSDKMSIYILISEQKVLTESFASIKEILKKFKGKTPVYFCTDKERKKFVIDSEYWVNPEEELLAYLKNRFGVKNIKVQY